jgi:hypothetical protein
MEDLNSSSTFAIGTLTFLEQGLCFTATSSVPGPISIYGLTSEDTSKNLDTTRSRSKMATRVQKQTE